MNGLPFLTQKSVLENVDPAARNSGRLPSSPFQPETNFFKHSRRSKITFYDCRGDSMQAKRLDPERADKAQGLRSVTLAPLRSPE